MSEFDPKSFGALPMPGDGERLASTPGSSSEWAINTRKEGFEVVARRVVGAFAEAYQTQENAALSHDDTALILNFVLFAYRKDNRRVSPRAIMKIAQEFGMNFDQGSDSFTTPLDPTT